MRKKSYGIDFEPETIGEEYAMLAGRVEALDAVMEIDESICKSDAKISADVVRAILGIKKSKKGET